MTTIDAKIPKKYPGITIFGKRARVEVRLIDGRGGVFISKNGEILDTKVAGSILEDLKKFYDGCDSKSIREHNRATILGGPRPALHRWTRDGGFVYIIKALGYYKIGKTTNVEERMRAISVYLPCDPELVHAIETTQAHWAERLLHYVFKERHVRGEWFSLSGADIARIKALDDAGLTELNREARETAYQELEDGEFMESVFFGRR